MGAVIPNQLTLVLNSSLNCKLVHFSLVVTMANYVFLPVSGGRQGNLPLCDSRQAQEGKECLFLNIVFTLALKIVFSLFVVIETIFVSVPGQSTQKPLNSN